MCAKESELCHGFQLGNGIMFYHVKARFEVNETVRFGR